MNITRRYKRDGLRGVFSSVATRLRLRNENPFAHALKTLRNAPCIVQIGAYVGNTPNDPLWGFFQHHKVNPIHGLKAVLVEPIGEYCEKLRLNLGNIPGVAVENCAIAESAGEREMTRLSVNPVDHGMPEWLAQLSSLKPGYVDSFWSGPEVAGYGKQYYDFVKKHTVTERVRCMTFAELFAKHEIGRIDLMQIDVEGYEFELLKTLDFKTHRPRFINLEYVHLGENEWPCWQLLKGHGYALEDVGEDTFCTLH
jgi:FkbM family methyltransferase